MPIAFMRQICVLLLLPTLLLAQNKDYPQDYFRNPLDIPIFLAGNFGECRPGHFHSGIDIKTMGKENQPVHAVADGYISRIKMEKGGFGHGIYITHPNGYTTLYAHLNDFAPAIQQYVHLQQYKQQRWDVDLQLDPGQFRVNKGQQIAWSGNTGASTAPHLHFEIRNTKSEHPLNPELFGLPITDKLAPVPLELAVYCGNLYQHPPVIAALQKKGVQYVPTRLTTGNGTLSKDTIEVNGAELGIGIHVDDFMDGSDNSLTFYTARLMVDDTLCNQLTLDDIGYDETRYINACTDYKTRKTTGKWFQLLFRLPGNQLGRVFSFSRGNNGLLKMDGRAAHKVDLILRDDLGNESQVSFYLRSKGSLMDSTGAGTLFKVGEVNKFNDPNLTFTLDERQLYDDVYFSFSKKKDDQYYSDVYAVHYPYVPIHHHFDLLVKPTRPVPFDLRGKMVLKYSDGKDEEGSAAVPADGGWYKTSVREFGTYWLEVDTIPPVIKSLQKQRAILTKAKQIAFDVKDAATSVKKFNGYIDDRWVCFEQHGSSFFYKFDEHCTKGKHELLFKAADENGNTATYNLTFTR